MPDSRQPSDPNPPTTQPTKSGKPSPQAEPASAEVPAEVSENLRPVVEQVMEILHVGPAKHPVLQHLTSEHLSRALTNRAKKDERSDALDRLKTLWLPIIFIIGVVLVLGVIFALCWLFLSFDKSDHIGTIIGLIIGFASGGLGGYGFGAAKRQRER